MGNAQIREISTEQKIKEAAARIFTRKGFAATKTREIAEEAGINLALLNYYFRSKEKLYQIVMEENMQAFKLGLAELFGDQTLDVHQKIGKLANYYIDEFIAHKELPAFIIATINSNDFSDLFREDEQHLIRSRNVFMQQITDLMNSKKVNAIHPMHIISNLIGLIMFPFAASPMLKKRARLTDKEFEQLMLERKKLIPLWMKAILHVSLPTSL